MRWCLLLCVLSSKPIIHSYWRIDFNRRQTAIENSDIFDNYFLPQNQSLKRETLGLLTYNDKFSPGRQNKLQDPQGQQELLPTRERSRISHSTCLFFPPGYSENQPRLKVFTSPISTPCGHPQTLLELCCLQALAQWHSLGTALAHATAGSSCVLPSLPSTPPFFQSFIKIPSGPSAP